MGYGDKLESVFCTPRFLSYLRVRCIQLELPLHYFLQRPDEESFEVIRNVLSKANPDIVEFLAGHVAGQSMEELAARFRESRGYRISQAVIARKLDRLVGLMTQPPERSPDKRQRPKPQCQPAWEPSPEEIRAECEKIQSTWSPNEERTRRGLAFHEEDEEGSLPQTCRSTVAEPYCGPVE